MSLNATRMIVNFRGKSKAFFKIAFSQQDASLYLFSYGPTGKYFYGGQKMAENALSHSFSFREQFDSEEIPKISIHESGRIHVYYDRTQIVGPINTLPLEEWRGQHLATISADSFSSLMDYERRLKTTGSELDTVTPCDNEVESGRMAIYCNGEREEFVYKCGVVFKFERPTLKRPLYIGISPIAQHPIGEGSSGGVTVICGWNPLKGAMDEQDFLFVRAM
jgi:hypothetical protein